MSRNFELMQQLETDSWLQTPGREGGKGSAREEDVTERRSASLPSTDQVLRLVQRVFLPQTDDCPHVVVFSGVNHGEGCSQICASAADVLAKSVSGSVCLLEANFRTPTLPALFQTTNHHGLTNSLLTEGPIRSFAKPMRRDKKLWLLSSGELGTDSPNLLTSERMKLRIAELRSEFEFVLIDTPPMTPYGDTITIGPLTDGCVMVLEAESTRREPALMATEALRTAGIPILAAVLNNRTFPIPEKLYNHL
ncbi:MAG: CpsD/CapB family tyrosine-protein kinase [Acidobacteriaceae bacterium]